MSAIGERRLSGGERRHSGGERRLSGGERRHSGGERRHSGPSYVTPERMRMVLEEHSAILETRLEQLNARMTAVEESLRHFQVQLAKQDYERLHEAIVAQQEMLEQMQTEFEGCYDENKDLRARVCTLEKKVNELENQLSTYKEDDCVWDLASVALIFEMAICWHVMPDVYTGDKRTSRIHDVHDYVNDIQDIEDLADIMMDEHRALNIPQCLHRWEGVCRKLGWPIKWERDKPPRELKVLKIIASLSSGRPKCTLSSPINIGDAVEKTREMKGLPPIKIKLIVDFLIGVPAKLAHCGLNYEDPRYYS